MVADEVDWLGQKAARLLSDYERLQPEHELRTFEDVERLWETAVRPRLKDFETMRKSWSDAQALPESSVWHANWDIPDRG